MNWDQLDDRCFLFTHKCGAVFTMSMEKILEDVEKENPVGLSNLRCPFCFQHLFASKNPEAEGLGDSLAEFCKSYKVLSEKLKKQDLTMIEIDREKQNEMRPAVTDPFALP